MDDAHDSTDVILIYITVAFFSCDSAVFVELLFRRKRGYMIYSDVFNKEGT